MRIISGFFKGKNIQDPKDIKTRPLRDLVKESIFNIINHSNKFEINLENSFVLDLFSGVGSFGIECLSRGAAKVVFVENYNGVLPILKSNLLRLSKIKNYEIIENDIYNEVVLLKLDQKFNLIFLDPPFKDKINELLLNIESNKILSENGIIIIHRHKSEKDILPKSFKIIEEKNYGLSKILFLLQLN